MDVATLKVPQKAFFDINRDVLIYLFTLFLIMPTTINLVGGRYDATLTATTGNTVWQLIELLAFADCIIIARYSNIAPRLIYLCLLPFVAILIWSILSTAWSEYPWLTFRRSSRLVIEIVSFVILAVSISTSEGVLRILFRVFVVITVLDIISIAVPSISQTDIGFAGVHSHKNLAGEFFYLALPVFFFGILDRSVSRFRGLAFCAFASAAGMLLISHSKTALGAALIATTFSVATRIIVSTRYRIPLLFICLLIVLLLVLIVSYKGVPEVINYLYGDPTLSGRDDIWRYTLYKFDGSPLIGVGFGALWEIGPSLDAALIDQGITFGGINEAHNGYIDILAQLGIIGLLLLVMFLLMNLSLVYRYARSLEGRKSVGLADYANYLFWGGIVYNLTESLFFVSCGMWFLFVFVLSAARGRFALVVQPHPSAAIHAVPQPGNKTGQEGRNRSGRSFVQRSSR